jgi:hypothetical protein
VNAAFKADFKGMKMSILFVLCYLANISGAPGLWAPYSLIEALLIVDFSW